MSDVKTKTGNYLNTVKTVSMATSMESKPSAGLWKFKRLIKT